jgi:hypothetical protein
MRTRSVVVALVVILAVLTSPARAPAQGASPEVRPPSGSPSPSAGPARTRRPAPGFVLLLVVLVLGLAWQVQRTRRSTSEISQRTLSDFERKVRPDPDDPAE